MVGGKARRGQKKIGDEKERTTDSKDLPPGGEDLIMDKKNPSHGLAIKKNKGNRDKNQCD